MCNLLQNKNNSISYFNIAMVGQKNFFHCPCSDWRKVVSLFLGLGPMSCRFCPAPESNTSITVRKLRGDISYPPVKLRAVYDNDKKYLDILYCYHSRSRYVINAPKCIRVCSFQAARHFGDADNARGAQHISSTVCRFYFGAGIVRPAGQER